MILLILIIFFINYYIILFIIILRLYAIRLDYYKYTALKLCVHVKCLDSTLGLHLKLWAYHNVGS